MSRIIDPNIRRQIIQDSPILYDNNGSPIYTNDGVINSPSALKRSISAALSVGALIAALLSPSRAEGGQFIVHQHSGITQTVDAQRVIAETNALYQGENGTVGFTNVSSSGNKSSNLLETRLDLPDQWKRKGSLFIFAGRDDEGNDGVEAKYRSDLASNGDISFLVGISSSDNLMPTYYGTIKLGKTLDPNGFRASYIGGVNGSSLNFSIWKQLMDTLFFGAEYDTKGNLKLWNSIQPKKGESGLSYRLFVDSDLRSSNFIKFTLANHADQEGWYGLGTVDAAFFRDHDGLEGESPLVLTKGVNADQYKVPASEAWRLKDGYGLLFTSFNSSNGHRHDARLMGQIQGPHYFDIGPAIIVPEQGNKLIAASFGYAFNGGKWKLYLGFNPVEGHNNDTASFQLSYGR